MSLYFLETGNKNPETIVFIHGAGVSGWMWDKQVKHFTDYHCLIPDLPEHGKSINEKPLSIRESSRRIINLIEEKAKNKKAHIVGHSLGAKIALDIIALRPDLIRHAIIASALVRNMPFVNLFSNPLFYKMSVAMVKNEALLKLQAKQFDFPDKYYVENFINDSKLLTVETLDRIFSESFSIPEDLNNIDNKCLVLAGDKEPKAMKESVRDLIKVIPNSKGVFIKNAKHNFPWAYHDLFNYLIRQWLEDEPYNSELVIKL